MSANQKSITITQIYNPIICTAGSHTGELDVQITNANGDLLRDPEGDNFSDIGEWEICDKWAPEQAAKYGKAVANFKENSSVEISEDGVTRIIKSTLYY